MIETVDKKDKKVISIYIEQDLLEYVEKQAKYYGMPRSSFITFCVATYKKQEQEKNAILQFNEIVKLLIPNLENNKPEDLNQLLDKLKKQ
jgi:metal-responsive CopG/Arc/MetJ family transcriptional regulator